MRANIVDNAVRQQIACGLTRRQQLAGKLQERYGLATDRVEAEIATWERSVSDDWFRP